MKKLIFTLLLLPTILFAQPFNISQESLDFQSVYYTQSDSIQITLDNTTGFDIGVTGITVFSIYGKKPFFVKDSVFTMSSGDSHSLWVYFEPEQNILHQMVAVIETDFRGDYVIDLIGKGKFLNTYYTSTYNKYEQDLKTALRTRLAQGYQSHSYNASRDEMYGSMDNVGGDVTCVYTARVATFNTRSGATANNFNCEHTFPQGFFNQNLPMRSDIHHLYSTDVTSNSRRSNLPFGVVTGTPTWSVGGSKLGGGKFEPRDDHKGAVARSLFYFVIRYQDYSDHVKGQEAILRTWFNTYAPSAKEIKRNNDIYAFQNNRNPFVDYPQLLKRINKISGTSTAPSVKSLYVSRSAVDMNASVDSTLFTISVVNTGNTLVSLTDFSISNTANYSFETAMSDRGLLPGEAYEIKVRATPSSNTVVAEQLTFNTDVSGMDTVTIDLLADWGLVSTRNIELVKSPLIYPNPTSNQFVISWENHSGFEVEVYNILGEMVRYELVRGESTQINVNQLSSGVYVVKTTSGDVVKQVSLVVE
jgi:hypothetical protein